MHREGALPELLIPASSLEVLKTAVVFGADAVYIGGQAFSLRAKAKNFSSEDMKEGIAFAHERGVKVYVTVNILAHNADLGEARAYLEELRFLQPDGFIIADPGIFTLAGEICPEIERHISTQANNVNYETFLFWHRLGASRVVCGRELSLKEIREIREHIPDGLEIEAFVHGAMCISYSGRCLVSNYLAGRDANRGACTHPCRWNYTLYTGPQAPDGEGGPELLYFAEEKTRPGEYLPVYENDRGTFLFNSKDLCMVEHIPDMIRAGIDSLKIEGRMKNALYVATVARTYRKALDDWAKGEKVYEANLPWYREQIRDCTYREFTTGFFYEKPGTDAQIYDSNTYIKNYTYLGWAEEVYAAEDFERIIGQSSASGDSIHCDSQRCFGSGNAGEDKIKHIENIRYVKITQKNKCSVGETIEVMKPDGENIESKIIDMRDEAGAPILSAPHSKQKVYLAFETNIGKYDILRRQEPSDGVGC